MSSNTHNAPLEPPHTDASQKHRRPASTTPPPPHPAHLQRGWSDRQTAASPPTRHTADEQHNAYRSTAPNHPIRQNYCELAALIHTNAPSPALSVCLSIADLVCSNAVFFFAWQHSELSMLSESQQSESCDLQLTRERERSNAFAWIVRKKIKPTIFKSNSIYLIFHLILLHCWDIFCK